MLHYQWLFLLFFSILKIRANPQFDGDYEEPFYEEDYSEPAFFDCEGETCPKFIDDELKAKMLNSTHVQVSWKVSPIGEEQFTTRIHFKQSKDSSSQLTILDLNQNQAVFELQPKEIKHLEPQTSFEVSFLIFKEYEYGESLEISDSKNITLVLIEPPGRNDKILFVPNPTQSKKEKSQNITWESQCSVNCEKDGYAGVVTVHKLNCDIVDGDEFKCNPAVDFETRPCQNLPKCPQECECGQWTCWSDCSKTCVNSAQEKSVKTRIRICSEGCSIVSFFLEWVGLEFLANKK